LFCCYRSSLLIAGRRSFRLPPQVDLSFRAFLPLFEKGTNRFVNGDPKVWKQNTSPSADATIMAGWGAYERGWTEISARYDWAAARFQESGAEVNIEYLASGISGDLAYTVAIERCEARLVGHDKLAPMPLRVTNIFWKENGHWKLLHHHADPIITKTAPTAVLHK
jgi:ketosteroid isomerase-like protein